MKALVTGGGGFLGSAIVRLLLARGDSVHTLQRGDYPWMLAQGVVPFRADLSRDTDSLLQAAKGCDVVIHTAAKAGVWGPLRDYHEANVLAVQHVLDACRKAGVSRLVHTSSPSVCFAGTDESGVDESRPYPARFLAHYPRTKAAAERLVLNTNSPGLATLALRPHLIWGPGDPHLVPRLIERARAGRLRLVGSGNNRVDSTYIDNAAQAHLDAADALLAQGHQAPAAGRAFYISNGEPIPMRELINRILHAGGLAPITRGVPPALAYAAGAALEAIYGLFRRSDEPVMTRFVARQLGTEHWYRLDAARAAIGYRPRVSLDEGMRRLAASLANPNGAAHA